MSEQIEQATLKRMRSFAKREFDRLRSTDPEFMYCHESFAATEALKRTEQKYETYSRALTHGVEGCSELNLTYLNTGDCHEQTILFRNGRFSIGCWGDIAERQLR
jgi:hypothetical protein